MTCLRLVCTWVKRGLVNSQGAAVEAMNGVYRKNGTLHQDRPVYVHVSHTGWIIYYSGEGWEIGPGTRTGAFHVSADGAEAAAPTEVPGPWRTLPRHWEESSMKLFSIQLCSTLERQLCTCYRLPFLC
eukprot:3027071-Amphidinium_carterae.1